MVGAGVCSQVDALHHSSGLGGPSLGSNWNGYLNLETAIVQAFSAHETWHGSQFHRGQGAMETSKEHVTCRLRDQSLTVGRTTESTNQKSPQVGPGNTMQAGILRTQEHACCWSRSRRRLPECIRGRSRKLASSSPSWREVHIGKAEPFLEHLKDHG